MSPQVYPMLSLESVALMMARQIRWVEGKQPLPPSGPLTLRDLEQLQGELGSFLSPFLTRPLTEHTLEAIQNYMLQASPLIRHAVVSSTWSARGAIDLEMLLQAIRRIDPEAAREAFMPFVETYRQSLLTSRSMNMALSFAQEVGGVLGAAQLVSILGKPITFNPQYPGTVDWVVNNSANLVRQVTQETQLAIRDVINRAFVEGLDPRQAAKPIVQILKADDVASMVADTSGLTRHQARTVGRYYTRLVEDGMDAAQALKRTKKYASRMLKRRAETIARTEMVKAMNAGQQAAWEQAIAEGTLNPFSVQKVWQTAADDRTCPICQPMEGKLVAVQGSFSVAIRSSPNAPIRREVTHKHPPAHPNCRCRVYLEPVPAFFGEAA